jgi:hypothetical protein
MVALKLVRLIEKHSEELVQGLAEQIHTSARMCDFRKIPPAELELAAAEVYRNLGAWLLQKMRMISRAGLGQSPHAEQPRESVCISLCGP